MIPNSRAQNRRVGNIYEVESAPAVREHYPLLAKACHVVANIRIRNMATIGGNLAHADSQSDPPAALVALDAERRTQQERWQADRPARRFFARQLRDCSRAR